jgi:HKD family nuclease
MNPNIITIGNITNDDSMLKHIKELFLESSEIKIAVAFLKTSGLELVEKELKIALKKGITFHLIVGLDFGFSDYEALYKLLHLFEQYKNANLFFAQGSKGVFHPKLYLFNNKKSATIITGSSNFTKGGFSDNIEYSLRVDCSLSSKLYKDSLKTFENLIKSTEVFEASFLTLEKYKPFQRYQSDIRNKKLQQKPNQSDDDELLELNTNKLKEKFSRFLKRKRSNQDFVKRRKDYIEAKKILDKIANIKSFNTNNLYPHYAALVGGAGYKQKWHSGGLNRGISKVKKHPQKFQNLVKYIKKNHHKPVDEVFENTMKIADQIPKLGINVVTEMLATYNPQKFAIVNNSPVVALRYFGVYTKNKSSFDGLYYSVFCRWMCEIQKLIGAKSLLEVDGFFNYIYWILKERNNK